MTSVRPLTLHLCVVCEYLLFMKKPLSCWVSSFWTRLLCCVIPSPSGLLAAYVCVVLKLQCVGTCGQDWTKTTASCHTLWMCRMVNLNSALCWRFMHTMMFLGVKSCSVILMAHVWERGGSRFLSSIHQSNLSPNPNPDCLQLPSFIQSPSSHLSIQYFRVLCLLRYSIFSGSKLSRSISGEATQHMHIFWV